MGQVSSTVQPHGLYQTSPQRFHIKQIQAYPNEGDETGVGQALDPISPAPILSVGLEPPSSPQQTVTVSRPSGRPLEYVQDPASQQMILKVPFVASITFRFRVSMLATTNQGVANLTFVTAEKRRQLDAFVDSELLRNPNIQDEENVVLLGDFVATSDAPHIYQRDFLWTWRPPASELDRPGGWPVFFCFAEYDKNNHRLSPLAGGEFWVGERPAAEAALAASFDALRVSSPQQDLTSPLDLPAYLASLDVLSPDTSLQIVSRDRDRDIFGSPQVLSPIGEGLGPSIMPVSNSVGNSAAANAANTGNPTNPALNPASTTNSAVSSTLTNSTPATSTNSGAAGGAAGVPAAGAVPGAVPGAAAGTAGPVTTTLSGGSVARPHAESISQPEDGPLFRSTIQAMERKSTALKAQIKKLLKRAILLHERLAAANEAQQWFFMALQQASQTDIPSLKPVSQYHQRSDGHGLGALVTSNTHILNNLVRNVIEPLRDLYECEIKTFEQRKREFEDESSQYYSWMSRYLSNRKRTEYDAKFAEKRRVFELSRFDYYTYLVDLHGGRKQQVLVHKLAKYSQRLTDEAVSLGTMLATHAKPGLDLVVQDLHEASMEWSRQRTDREVRRRQLERSNGESDVPPPILSRDPQIHAGNAAAAAPVSAPTASGAVQSSVAKPSALDANAAVSDNAPAPQPAAPPQESSRKEGLLWALSRPGGVQEQNLQKQVGLKWHKYWVVQDKGKICEYTNWKQGLDLHNEPIDLMVANVREARNAERRFCFEVVTPQYKRVYQATSDEDMRQWIRAIDRGISKSLEGPPSGALTGPLPSALGPGSLAAGGGGGELQMSKQRETKEKLEKLGRKLSLKADRPRINANVEPVQPAILSASSEQTVPISRDLGPNSPLIQVHHATSNLWCADCGSAKSVEWVSINLMMVLCIDCSGAHRSLGSHISKVRSLTLDTVSFTPDMIAALASVSNQTMNGIWEARLASRPTVTDKNRLTFISEKYVEKLYVAELEKPNAALRKAVVDQDVVKAAAALASRANPNGMSDSDEPILISALRSAQPGVKVFPIAELLVVNGASVPVPPPADLSVEAKAFLSLRARS